MTEPEHPDDRHDRDQDRWREYVAEAAVGLVIALLLLWVAIASTTDVPFVYQGL